ncbi:MAG: FliA/WhiG family RNA polymerase sigma factor [Nitrospirae bacterium]|nr:MAG: FliA/WhiG family RNA polymerase sigma factor [Nitrospirota bacterium]
MYRHRVSGLKSSNPSSTKSATTSSPRSTKVSPRRQALPAKSAGEAQLTTDLEKVVRDFLPLIRRIALELAWRNPGALDIEDLTSAGTIGLLAAFSRYDASRDTTFRTYAEYRIRGAMLDEIRAMDWVPRSVRTQMDKLQQAVSELTRTKGRAPDFSEIAEMLGMNVDELADLPCREATLVSLDEWVGEGEHACTLKEILPAADQQNPFERCLSHQLGKALHAAIDRLPERQRRIIRLYYFSGLTMKAIGALYGLTESGVCRIHADALTKLRSDLEAIARELRDSPSMPPSQKRHPSRTRERKPPRC